MQKTILTNIPFQQACQQHLFFKIVYRLSNSNQLTKIIIITYIYHSKTASEIVVVGTAMVVCWRRQHRHSNHLWYKNKNNQNKLQWRNTILLKYYLTNNCASSTTNSRSYKNTKNRNRNSSNNTKLFTSIRIEWTCGIHIAAHSLHSST